jgi:hypothetical protein
MTYAEHIGVALRIRSAETLVGDIASLVDFHLKRQYFFNGQYVRLSDSDDQRVQPCEIAAPKEVIGLPDSKEKL